MKLAEAIRKLGRKRAMNVARIIAGRSGIQWDTGISVVLGVIIRDPDRVPGNIGGINDDENVLIEKWLRKYQSGKDNRASKRKTRLPGTIADPLVEKIIGARLTGLSEEELKKVTYAHRLGMSAENILGSILEEYLAVKLEPSGWHCAWGDTVKAVDFIHEDGRLLQVKNRSNSENSSSSAVRRGTDIEKWFRIRADRIVYMWDTLNKKCGTDILSEKAFVQFAQTTIKNNPSCLAVEAESPWSETAK